MDVSFLAETVEYKNDNSMPVVFLIWFPIEKYYINQRMNKNKKAFQ